MVMMPGWLRAEAALASWMKRGLARGIGDLLRRQDLEGHEAVQVRVAGLIDDAHAAFAELVEDLIVQQPLAGHTASPEFQSRIILG